MKQFSLFLLLAFATNSIVSQTKIAESINFILEEKGYKEKVDYKYCLYNSSKEIVKKFDKTYWFKNPNKENLIIVSKEEGREYRYSIFDITKGDFITDWNYERITELNDSIFKLKLRNVNKESVNKWVIVNKKGEKLIEKDFTGYSGPSYDEKHQLIYSNYDKEIIEFFTTSGKTKYVLKGYDSPSIEDGLLFVTKDNKRGIIDFKEEVIVPFEYNQLEVSFGKLYGTKIINSKSVCEIYSDVERSKTEFSVEGDYILKSSYYNPNSFESIKYWMTANKKNQFFYDINYNLFLEWSGDVDANDSTYYLYWDIIQRHNDFYLLQFEYGSGLKNPIVVAKEGQVLTCKNEDVVFCRQNLDTKLYENSPYTILFDPQKKPQESILIIDNQKNFVPYKVIHQLDNMIVFEIEENGKKQIGHYNGEETITFFTNLNNASLKLMNADRTFFKNPDLLFFSTAENGKTSILANYFMYGSDHYSIGKTPAVFDKITKIYAYETYFHIIGIIDNKQVMAFCNAEKFNYVQVDKIPDMKLFGIEDYHSVIKIRSNNKMATINTMCEFVMQPKYNEIIPYNGEYSFCITDKKKGVGYLQAEGRFDEILPAEFDEIELVLGGDLWKVKKDGKYGMFYAHGQKSLDCLYDEIILNGWDGGYIVKKDGKYGVIGYDGSILYEIKFNSVEEIKKQSE
jgi:hypothetical protein